MSVIYNHGLSIANISTTVGALLQSAEIQVSAVNQQSRSQRSSRLTGKFFSRSVPVAALAIGLFSVLGCGSYRPVVTAISPVGPAGQPQKFAVAISDPNLGNASGTLPGLITFVDFSGDTILVTANIGVRPQYLILNSSGGTGYTLNGDGTVNTVPIATTLISSSIAQTTLLSTRHPNPPASSPRVHLPTLLSRDAGTSPS